MPKINLVNWYEVNINFLQKLYNEENDIEIKKRILVILEDYKDKLDNVRM